MTLARIAGIVQNEDMPLEDYYSVTEAANLLGVSKDAIHVAIKKGYLQARRNGNMLFIHKDELARYRREKRNPGRPRQKRKYERKTSS